RAGAQRAREELVEARVGGGIGLDRVAHVGIEAAHEQADERVLECRDTRACRPQHQARNAILWQQVLERDERAARRAGVFAHGAGFRMGLRRDRSRVSAAADNGGVNTATMRASESSVNTAAE